MADCSWVRRVGGLLAVVVAGCTFESGAVQSQPLDPAETSGSVSSTSSGGTSGGPRPGTTAALTSEGESGPSDDAVSSGDPKASSSSSGEPDGVTGEPTTGTTGTPVDCTVPITLTQTVAEAELFKPMQLGNFRGTQYAFSLSAGAGHARFTFDVACPSTYRLFGRVRDDSAGTSSCCDPDSFTVEGPNNLQHTWFYGCDTEVPGWTWAQVEAGENIETCGKTSDVMVPLPAGTHAFTLGNREPAYMGAHAGIAELVLTNDPSYTP